MFRRAVLLLLPFTVACSFDPYAERDCPPGQTNQGDNQCESTGSGSATPAVTAPGEDAGAASDTPEPADAGTAGGDR